MKTYMTTNLAEKLRTSVKDGTMSYGVLCDAVEKLKEPQEIKGYYNAFIELIKEDLQKNLIGGRDSDAGPVTAIKKGKVTLKQAAEYLAKDKFAYVLNKYYGSSKAENIHERWKRALPELYSINGRLPNILGF